MRSVKKPIVFVDNSSNSKSYDYGSQSGSSDLGPAVQPGDRSNYALKKKPTFKEVTLKKKMTFKEEAAHVNQIRKNQESAPMTMAD